MFLMCLFVIFIIFIFKSYVKSHNGLLDSDFKYYFYITSTTLYLKSESNNPLCDLFCVY